MKSSLKSCKTTELTLVPDVLGLIALRIQRHAHHTTGRKIRVGGDTRPYVIRIMSNILALAADSYQSILSSCFLDGDLVSVITNMAIGVFPMLAVILITAKQISATSDSLGNEASLSGRGSVHIW
ncbi:hypothetical protein NEOLEDRAFT_1139646 [Neolentinus lepideus HHB14362 ss-1]|uniref:Uncharacterized protein n=1 Tax=Neolentinus lepideus HHB14362 ss-1 TaxID=1314782 RepID=A0A165PP62_9AGAM|nr:hypothetical protein NEOLEDRAFT_1139646 [Neolentinus lepideus HHB14362 ss-1]